MPWVIFDLGWKAYIQSSVDLGGLLPPLPALSQFVQGIPTGCSVSSGHDSVEGAEVRSFRLIVKFEGENYLGVSKKYFVRYDSTRRNHCQSLAQSSSLWRFETHLTRNNNFWLNRQGKIGMRSRSDRPLTCSLVSPSMLLLTSERRAIMRPIRQRHRLR